MSIDKFRMIAMTIAEAFDYFRVVPRIIILAYSYLMYECSFWFMALTAPTTAQASIIVTLLGVAGAIIGLYQKSGKNWDADFKPFDKD